jgi:hypothetical protein
MQHLYLKEPDSKYKNRNEREKDHKHLPLDAYAFTAFGMWIHSYFHFASPLSFVSVL